jgi:hypothetical protein
LVENNIAYHLNSPILLEASGGGNVVAYNYADDSRNDDASGWQMPDLAVSCMFPYMELVEGNWFPHIGLYEVHGNAGYITFFRNLASARHLTRMDDSNITSFEIEPGMYYLNVVGNVLSSAGLGASYAGSDPGTPLVYSFRTQNTPQDPRVAATLLRHGNFDYVHGDVRWDPGIALRQLPDSLYLATKPAFFGNAAWPWVHPDLREKASELPARTRFMTTAARP